MFCISQKYLKNLEGFFFFLLEAREEHSVLWGTRVLSQTNGVASLSVICLSVWLLLTAAQQSDLWQLRGACALTFRVDPSFPLSLHPVQWHHLCCTKSQPHPLRCQGALLGSPFYSGYCNAKELFFIPAGANPTVLLWSATNERVLLYYSAFVISSCVVIYQLSPIWWVIHKDELIRQTPNLGGFISATLPLVMRSWKWNVHNSPGLCSDKISISKLSC